MRWRLTLSLIGVCSLCSGCSLVGQAVHDVAFGVSLRTSDVLECARNRKVAREVFAEIRKAHPAQGYSEDYARGFEDGFAEYLFNGRTGGPPPLPPPCYLDLSYETPAGYHAVQDWFAGFRHGVAEAQGSGYRRLITLPSSRPGVGLAPYPYSRPEYMPEPVPDPLLAQPGAVKAVPNSSEGPPTLPSPRKETGMPDAADAVPRQPQRLPPPSPLPRE